MLRQIALSKYRILWYCIIFMWQLKKQSWQGLLPIGSSMPVILLETAIKTCLRMPELPIYRQIPHKTSPINQFIWTGQAITTYSDQLSANWLSKDDHSQSQLSQPSHLFGNWIVVSSSATCLFNPFNVRIKLSSRILQDFCVSVFGTILNYHSLRDCTRHGRCRWVYIQRYHWLRLLIRTIYLITNQEQKISRHQTFDQCPPADSAQWVLSD